MFQKPFSFNGRIRRTEYGLSLIIYYFIYIFLATIVAFYNDGAIFMLGIFFVPLIIFILAQGVKRSHDLGNSGWMVLLPIYNPFFLLFAEGTRGANQYGKDPKIRADNFMRNFSQAPNNYTVPPTSVGSTPPPIFNNQKEIPITEVVPTTVTSEEPQQQYSISADGKTLIKWLNTAAITIDMSVDPILSEITTIEKDAFYNCNKITKIVFPEQLTTIKKFALDDCELLQNIVFPNKVNFIGEYLLGRNCVTTITLESKVPPVLEGDFSYNDEKLQAIYVPEGHISLYRNSEGWRKYAHLIKQQMY